MSDQPSEVRVSCRQCRYAFRVPQATIGSPTEVECPSCEAWATFTIEDTRDRPPPDERELHQETQRLGNRLWLPINANRAHPVVAFLDRVGNGLFEDDSSPRCWPVPCWVYRFTQENQAAYIWQEGGNWFVRGWYPLHRRGKPLKASSVVSFAAALDLLLA